MMDVIDVMLAKWLRIIRLKHHLHLADEYSIMTDRYMMLAGYLQELAKVTPHDNIEQEINDVLHQARHLSIRPGR